MLNQILLYSASVFLMIWGIAHLFPTRSIVKGFGDISKDNKHIITMEWIIEGISLIFIAIIVFSLTYIDHTSIISKTIYWISFGMLNTLSIISFFTGFKISFIPFKLCPFIFTTASILILLGILI
jgi:hypothetical protein